MVDTDGEETPRVERGPEAGLPDEVACVHQGGDARRVHVEGGSHYAEI